MYVHLYSVVYTPYCTALLKFSLGDFHSNAFYAASLISSSTSTLKALNPQSISAGTHVGQDVDLSTRISL
jgi:hypothetical protein